MRLIEYIAKARAARRAGYKMREVSFGMTLDPKGEVVWDGQISRPEQQTASKDADCEKHLH